MNAPADSQIADAARAWVAAFRANQAAEPRDWTGAWVELDRAQHVLFVLVEGECGWCDEGSCPVLVVGEDG